MHRADREISDFSEQLKIVAACDVCRPALNDDGYPYILPLNFGEEVIDGTLVLYFHGAARGKKYELIARNPRASFEMDCKHQPDSHEDRGYCTMHYDSIMGRGVLEILPDKEKLHALTVLVNHYHRARFFFDPAAIPRTTVLKLTVSQLTGKRR